MGGVSVEMMPSSMPTMPYSSPSNPPDAADAATVEKGGEAEFGVWARRLARTSWTLPCMKNEPEGFRRV
jgi:hypothetical protein